MKKVLITLILIALFCACDDSVPPVENAPSGDSGNGGGLVANPSVDGNPDVTIDNNPDGTTESGGGQQAGDADSSQVKYTTKIFESSSEIIMNPERGSVGWIGTSEMKNTGKDLSFIRNAGQTLAFADAQFDKFDVNAFRDKPLTPAFLDTLSNFFGRARSSGIKLVLRFSYGNVAPDAPLSRILEHIEQLKPVLTANADVIYVLQAGFIGYWGEWHHTSGGIKNDTNNLDNDTARAAVLSALLAALPETRMTQVRRPTFKSAYLGEGERIGHHNDCFLASNTDYGTYPSSEVEFWKDYINEDGLLVPVGGETCAINPPKTDCAQAVDEMNRLHWSFIRESSNAVISGWKSAGCWPEIMQNIGYSFVLKEASWNETIVRGEIISLKLTLSNEGYAPLYNERPVYAVLSDGTNKYPVKLSVEPRDWKPGEIIALETSLTLPADIPAGEYTLSLWLPDPLLQDDPRYSIQFANKDVWDPANGYNILTKSFVIN